MPFRRRSAEEAAKAGPRWTTVATSGMEDVAKRLAGNYNNDEKKKAMKERVLSNTKTSISFGNAPVRKQRSLYYLFNLHALAASFNNLP